MKSLSYLLTLVLLVMLSACTGKKTGGKESAYEKIYREALSAKDYKTATFALTAMASEEKPDTWVFDSLALYHFIYNQESAAMAARMVPDCDAAAYFADKGLKINPNNRFLKIVKIQTLMYKAQQDSNALKTADKMVLDLANANDYTGKYFQIQTNFLTGKTDEGIKLLQNGLKDSIGSNTLIDVFTPDAKNYRKVKYHTMLLYMMVAHFSKSEAEALGYIDEIIKTDPSFRETALDMRERLINQKAQPQR